MNLPEVKLMLRTIALCSAGLLLFAACGGGDGGDGNGSNGRNGGSGDGPRFDPARADELAHAALPAVDALPGAGWQVTATDEFGDGDGGDSGEEFLAMAREEPACQQLTDLVGLGEVFDGGEADESVLGRAQVEFQRPVGATTLPSNVEVEVEISETVADAQGGWNIARAFLQSDETGACLATLMGRAIEEEADGLFTVKLESMAPLAPAPQDGAAVAFRMEIELAGVLSIDAVMGVYMWPYSNAAIQVTILGAEDELDAEAFAAILEAVDASVTAAGD